MDADEDDRAAFPYPERDPAEEAERLIIGSPSHPMEIDHFLFGGKRDWRRPFRALFAGGGTGDGMVQLAQMLTTARRPYDITWLDPSVTAREIAEARIAARGLTGVSFETGSVLNAPQLGPFDYVECSGALSRLEEPQRGFEALAGAVTEAGGIGLMVHAPYGRTGTAPLQAALGRVLHGTPRERLRRAKSILARLPEGHPFKRNLLLAEDAQSGAGLYDLLLRARDRAFTIRELMKALRRAGLSYVGSPQAYLYDPLPILGDPACLRDTDEITRMELAEQLRGTIRTHIAYAVRGKPEGRVARADLEAIPNIKGVSGAKLAEVVAARGVLPVKFEGEKVELPVPGMAAKCLGLVDGRRTLSQIAHEAGLDPVAFHSIWTPLSNDMARMGLLYYSRLLARN